MAKNQDVLVTGTDLHVSKDVIVQEQQRAEKPKSEPKELKDLPRFTANRSVHAAKLRSVDRVEGGVVTLHPEDTAFPSSQLGGTQAAAIPGWNPSTPNSDPGYLVIEDNGNRYWLSTADFEALYKS